MKPSLDENKPIFEQIAETIEDEIMSGGFKEEEQVPSTNQFASLYQINPATAAKGLNKLVEEGILFKKRGIGMFVTSGAREKLIEKRKQYFSSEYVWPMLQEASKLNMSWDELEGIIRASYTQLEKERDHDGE